MTSLTNDMRTGIELRRAAKVIVFRTWAVMIAVLLSLQSLPVDAHQSIKVPINTNSQNGKSKNNVLNIPVVLPGRLSKNTVMIDSTSLTGDQISQILSSGRKTFFVDPTSPISGNITIPKGVTLVTADTSTDFSLTGDLVTSGRFLLAGTGIANLSANNIFINTKGLISTAPASQNLSLNISAVNNIINNGRIFSSGNLTLSAGGSITNGSSNGAALIQALGSVNLLPGNGSLTNTGIISALGGNLNIASNEAMNVLNKAGLMYAKNAINFRDTSYAGQSNINLAGGNLISDDLNLYSGKGTVDVSVENITGVVNVEACNAHIGADTPNLKLGVLDVSGDPTYYNTGGNVNITSGFSTSTAALAILASGNISITNSIINTGGAGSAGNILMVAGAAISSPASVDNQVDNNSGTAVVLTNGVGSDGGSATGGSITIDASSLIGAVGGAGGNGGNVTLVAYKGSDGFSGLVTTASQIATGGNGNGANGDVTIIAGSNSGIAITAAFIDTTGCTSTSTSSQMGKVVMAAATPTITGGDISVTNGVATGGTFTVSSFKGGDINVAQIQTNGGAVQLATEGNITLSNTITTAPITSNNNQGAGPVALLAGGSVSSSGSTSIDTALTSSARGTGKIFVVAGADLDPGTTATEVIVGGPSTNGGNVNFNNVTLTATGSGCCVGTQSGADVTVLAFKGTNGGGGSISLPTGQTSINTSQINTNLYASGNITVTAGGDGPAITAGDLNAGSAGFGNTLNGRVGVIAAQPTVGSGVTFNNGVVTAGTIGADTNNLNGSIQIEDVSTPRCNAGSGEADVMIQAGGDVTVGSITASPLAGFTIPKVTIVAQNGNLNVVGGASGAINANPSSTNRNGGTVSLTFKDLIVSGSAPFQINANGVGTGGGGDVSIIETGTSGLTIGNATSGHNIQISAISGASGGNGGIITAKSGGSLTVDPTAITADPNAGFNGQGATFDFEASTSGVVNVLSGLNVNGVGGGKGGSVTIISNSNLFPLQLNSTAQNCVNGTISANGGTSGAGGSITLKNLGQSGVIIDPGAVSVTASGNGNGGSLDFESGAGLGIQAGTLSADPAGSGTGGSITLGTGALSLPSGGLSVSTGGTFFVKVTNINAGANLNLGNTYSAKDIVLISNSGQFTLGDLVTASNSLALIQKDTIANLNGVTSGPTIVLVATGLSQGIGTDAISGRISVDASSVTAQASSGNVFLTSTSSGDGSGNVNLVNATVDGNGYSNTAAGTYSFKASGLAPGKSIVTASGVQVSAANVVLTSSGTFSFGDTVTGTSSVALVSNDSITSLTNVVYGPTLVLVVTGSSSTIGTDASTRLTIDAATVTLNAFPTSSGSVFVTDTSTGDSNGNINLVASTVDGNVYDSRASNVFSFIANGISPGKNVKIPGTVAGSTSIDLTSSGGFDITGIFSGQNAALISNDSILSLGSGVTFSAGLLTLAATGTGSSIGTSSNPIQFGHLSVTAQADADVWLSEPFNLTVSLQGSNVNGNNYYNQANANSGTYRLTAVKAINLSGVQTLAAHNVILTSQTTNLNLKGGNITANNITLNAATGLTLSDNTLSVVAATGTGNGGSITITSFNISGFATPVNLNANATGSGNGGTIDIILTNGAGSTTIDNANLILNATGGPTGGNGGTVSVNTAGSLTFAASGVVVDPDATFGSNGGHVTMVAASTLTLSDASYTYNGAGNGDGGNLFLQGNQITANKSFTANGSGVGNGGVVTFRDTNSSANIIVAAGSNTFTATSGASGGNGGSVIVFSGDDLTFNNNGVSVDPLSSGDGGHVSMIATGTLTLANGSYSYNGVGTSGNGGLVSLEGGTISFGGGPLSISVNASGTGNGGTLQFLVNGGSLVVDSTNFTALNAKGGSASSVAGNGGTIQLSASSNLSVDGSLINVNPIGDNGNGGAIILTGDTVTNALGGTLSLVANGGGLGGVGNGNGGTLSVTRLSNSAATIASGADYEFHAHAGFGVLGGDGGSVTFVNGGSLTVDPGAIDVQPISPTNVEVANGGTISLTSTSSTLLVLGTLTANSAGTNTNSVGGTISLSSNSATPFVINSLTAINGVRDTLSATGTNTDGTISVTNSGGGVTNLQPGLTAETLTLTSNGPLSLSVPLGSLTAGTINLNVSNNSPISAPLIQADNINAVTNGGSITLKPNVGNISTSVFAQTSGTGLISITGIAVSPAVAGDLTVSATSNSTLAVISAGNIIVGGSSGINAGAVTLTAASKTLVPQITVSAPISSTGLVTMTAPGDININSSIFGAAGVKATASGVGSAITAFDDISTGALGGILLTATAGSIDVSGADVSAGVSVTMSAKAGGVQVGSIGEAQNPGTVTLTGATVSVTDDITCVTLFKAAAKSATLGFGTITINGDINVSGGGGASLLASSDITLLGDLSATTSVIATTKVGDLNLNSVGVVHPSTTVALTGANVTSTGSITGINSVLIKGAGKLAGTGNVDLGGDVTALSLAGIVTVTGGALGTITDNAASSTISGKTITILGPAGITMDADLQGSSTVIMTAKAGSISLGSTSLISTGGVVTITAFNDLDANGDIAGSAVTLKTTNLLGGHLIVNNVTTSNGLLFISGAGSEVRLLTGATLTANSAAGAATITIQDVNATSGSVVIEGGNTSLNTNGFLSGNINIAVGKAASIVGGFPNGINYQINGGNVLPTAPPFFFGINPAAIDTGATPGNITLDSVSGGKISFNTLTQPITLDTSLGTITMTADPPGLSNVRVANHVALTALQTAPKVVSGTVQSDASFQLVDHSVLGNAALQLNSVATDVTRVFAPQQVSVTERAGEVTIVDSESESGVAQMSSVDEYFIDTGDDE